MKEVKRPVASESALRLFLLLVCSVFAANWFSHWLIHSALPNLEWLSGEALLDSTLLVALLFPSTYFFVFRPLKVHITERKHMEESRAQLAAIIDSSNDAIIGKDLNGIITSWNPAASALYGYTANEAIGQPVGILAPAERAQEDSALFDRVKRGEIITHYDTKRLRNDGSRAEVSLTFSPIKGASGEMVGVSTIARDISKRNQTEKLLRESEEHYRTLFNQATDGIFLLDMEGNVVRVNESLARMHGYSIDEFLNLNLSDLDTPETLAQTPARYARLRAGESIEFEVEHYHKDGFIVPLSVVASVIVIKGKPFVLAFHRDITERRVALQELKRSHEDLCALSRAASKALEAERRRMARELHDDLEGGLAALKMEVMWIKERLPAGQQAMVEKLPQMLEMLDGTVATTRRIASNLHPLILDSFGLVPAAEWLVEDFRKHNGIDCQLMIDDPCLDLPEFCATAVFRILQESLTNISKHARASLVNISISRVEGELRLTVRDNGCGFVSSDPRKPNSYGLTGMRERACLLQGELHIDSSPGQGTIIKLRIPIAQSRAEHEDYSV